MLVPFFLFLDYGQLISWYGIRMECVIGSRREKTCLRGVANNEGANQRISSFEVDSVADDAGLNLDFSKPRIQILSRRGPIYNII